jgi:hypothetical protein
MKCWIAALHLFAVSYASAQPHPSAPVQPSASAQTSGTRSLVRVEANLTDPETNVVTIDRITSSGTHVIWTYSPAGSEKKY